MSAVSPLGVSERTDLFPLEKAMRKYFFVASCFSLFPDLPPEKFHKYLETRIAEILLANPWLCSGIVTGKDAKGSRHGEQWEWPSKFDSVEHAKTRVVESAPGSGGFSASIKQKILSEATTKTEKIRAKAANPILIDVSGLVTNITEKDSHLTLCDKLSGKTGVGPGNKKCKKNFMAICRIEQNRPFVCVVFGIKKSADEKTASSSGIFVSISHSLGDGHTMYKILNMISVNTPIESMIMHRNFKDYCDQGVEFAYIPEPAKHLFKCLWFGEAGCMPSCCICCGFCSYFCCVGKKMGKEKSVRISKRAVEEAKREFKELVQSDPDKYGGTGAFISTNDAVTSAWFDYHGGKAGYKEVLFFEMAINARHRFEALKNPLLAGNYVCSGIFMASGGPWGPDGMDDMTAPGIRNGLINFKQEQPSTKNYSKLQEKRNAKAGAKGMPSWYQIGKRGMGMGTLTNWATDFKGIDVEVDGASYNCTAHMPNNMFGGGECFAPSGILYKARPKSEGQEEELALYGRTYADSKVLEKSDVFGKNVFGEEITETGLGDLMRSKGPE